MVQKHIGGILHVKEPAGRKARDVGVETKSIGIGDGNIRVINAIDDEIAPATDVGVSMTTGSVVITTTAGTVGSLLSQLPE